VCACRDDDGRKLWRRCPRLATDRRHGSWMFVTDVPTITGGRKQVRRHGFATKKAAEEARDEVLGRVAVGVAVDDRQTVAQYLDGWLAGKQRIRPTTRRAYTAHTNNVWKPLIGHLPLEQLRHEHVIVAVRRIIAEADERGRPLKVSSVSRMLGTLRAALGVAVKTRRLTHNPAQYVELPEYAKPEFVPWSLEEAGRFLDIIQAERLAALYELAMLEGLRRGELCGLRWADVDLEVGVIRIRNNRVDVAGTIFEGRPKTKSGERIIEIGGRTVEVLLGWQVRQNLERAEWGAAWSDTGYVFTRADGQPLRPEYVSRHFAKLIAKAKVPEIPLHGLRHMSASLQLVAGVPEATVSKRMGHSNGRITRELYGHLLGGVGRAASDAASALIPRSCDTTVTPLATGSDESAANDSDIYGATCRNRTDDLLITSEPLCRLS
jgi:integrase